MSCDSSIETLKKPTITDRGCPASPRLGFERLIRGAHFRGGFSLLEVMVVLVIIGLIAGLVTINVRSRMIVAKQSAAKTEIATLVEALETYYTIEGRYPTNDEGIEALAEPTDRLAEPLLDAVPNDPWNRPYEYLSPGRERPYELVSLGADGVEGGDGADADIVSWRLKGQDGDE